MIKITDTVKHLIIINVLFFAASIAFKDQIYDLLAMHFPENSLFKPWQLVSHMFMHGNFNANGSISIMHILFNMIGLWMFGSTVEQMIGRNRFLILYFIAGIGAVLFSVGIDYFQFNSIYNKLMQIGVSSEGIQNILDTGKYNTQLLDQVTAEDLSGMYSKFHTSLVGASGALYGVMVAFGVLMPKAKMGLMFLPIMIEARIFIPLLLLADVFFGVFRISGDNIGHFAHVGGAIFGFLVIWYWKKYKFTHYN